MDHRLSRQGLYDLVWSEPIIKVAARWGISGVAFAKACRRHDIPVPPRGYWAKLQAGKSQPRKTPLPARSLGASDYVEFGRRHWQANVVSNDELMTMELPPPQQFPESIDDLKTRVQRLVGTVRIPKDLSKPYRLVAKLLEAEAASRKERSYFTTPLFESPVERRRLRILSGLFTALDQAGMRPYMSGKDPSDFSVLVGDQHVSFTLDRLGNGYRFGHRSSEEARRPASESLKLEIKCHWKTDPVIVWQDKPGDLIEHRATEIVVTLIVRGEQQHRWSEHRHYDWLVERKARAIEDARKELEAELRAAREARIRAEKARVRRLLNEAASYRKANAIREYVETVRVANLSSTVPVDSDDIERWSDWALAQANRIDPVLSRAFQHDLDVPKE